MTEEELLTAKRYQRLFIEHGASHGTLNWGSREGQQLRFKVLAEIASLDGKRILDVGCGLGDFAGWLLKKKINADYTGIDLTPELVEQAKITFPGMKFLQGSILDEFLLNEMEFDYVFASGIFYTYSEGRDAWLKSAVARMWQLCRRGVAFNSLSAWAENQEPGEFYADPGETIAFCRSLTPWVTMRHDYHSRDFSIFMLREARQ